MFVMIMVMNHVLFFEHIIHDDDGTFYSDWFSEYSSELPCLNEKKHLLIYGFE